MTTIQEITWPAGAHHWLDSEFGPADVAAAKGALAAAGADTWVGYAPVGWPARPWPTASFEAALEAGAHMVALAVGPLSPTGDAFTLGETLARNWLAWAEGQGLRGKVLPGIDGEAQLFAKNGGFYSDMVAQFAAILEAAGELPGVYGPWPAIVAVHKQYPGGGLRWIWGTGNLAPELDLAAEGIPEPVLSNRADQFAWDVDVEGINCDLSVATFAPTVPAPAAPAEPVAPAPETPAPETPAAPGPAALISTLEAGLAALKGALGL